MPLPARVHFEGFVGNSTYRKLGFRAPRRGEFYLSGAIVVAYRAPNDFTTPYTVVEPTETLKAGFDFRKPVGA